MAEKIILEGIEVKIGSDRSSFVKELLGQLADGIREFVTQVINSVLEQEVDALLGRGWYKREYADSSSREEGYCLKCQTRKREDFLRNGYKKRQLTVGKVGTIEIRMPRLVCKRCGGTIHVEYQTIKFRQRLWDDVAEEVRESSGLGQSLREIKARMSERCESELGLRSINGFVQEMKRAAPSWKEREWSNCAPVVMLDAIWVKVMSPTGCKRLDSLGRQRLVKSGDRKPVMIALGVWPQEGKKLILDWEIGQGPGEDAASWLKLLTRLEGHGVNGQHGLRLIAHDGGSGLRQALDEVHFGARYQRCVFHKLRNILDSIVVPDDLKRQDARRLKKKLLREASAIWQAKHKETAQRRLAAFVEHWEKEQPKATATAQRDFVDTTAFYDVLEEAKKNGQVWSPTWLRTTSLLERANRTYRQRFRNAVVIHSIAGLEAILAQRAARIESPKFWSRRINDLVAHPV